MICMIHTKVSLSKISDNILKTGRNYSKIILKKYRNKNTSIQKNFRENVKK